MYLQRSLFYLLLFVTLGLQAQSSLTLESGLQHLRMRDQHASPLIYQSTGQGLGLKYRKRKEQSELRIGLMFMQSQLEPANGSLFRYDFGGDKNTILGGLAISYLRQHKNNRSFWWGLTANYSVYVDFEGVANFPWATLYGDLGLKVRKKLLRSKKILLHVEAGLPLLGLVTRQPYNFIPRVAGEEPGVGSLLQLGTQFASWGKYQRIDFAIEGLIMLNDRWSIIPAYRFHWARYAEPQSISIYRQAVDLGLNYTF